MLADFTSTVIFLFSARNFAAPQDSLNLIAEKRNLSIVGEKTANVGEKCAA